MPIDNGLSNKIFTHSIRHRAVISQVADNLKPPIYIATEVVKVEVSNAIKNVLVVHINLGINKLADEMEVYGTFISDIDEKLFANYFKKEFGRTFEERGLTFEQALRAKRVLRNNQLTLAGLLFFGKEPQVIKPAFTIKTVSFFGNDLGANEYRSKPKDLTGTIPELFDKGMDFFMSNLHFRQSGESFNSPGKLEVSRIALEELLQNALVHRDYFKNAPIRVLIFDNRIEMISPGKLPNAQWVDSGRYQIWQSGNQK